MSHWLSDLAAMAQSKSNDLRELAVILGQDPAEFYKHQDLSGCDLRGQNLEGMDLTGCNIINALIYERTVISPPFDPRYSDQDMYLRFIIHRNLNKLLLEFAEEANYRYPAWAFKSLLESGISIHRDGRWQFYSDIVSKNKNFADALDHRSKSSCVSKTLLIYPVQQDYVSNIMRIEHESNKYPLIMFIGLLAHKIKFGVNKDYSGLTLNSLIRRKMTGIVDSLE